MENTTIASRIDSFFLLTVFIGGFVGFIGSVLANKFGSQINAGIDRTFGAPQNFIRRRRHRNILHFCADNIIYYSIAKDARLMIIYISNYFFTILKYIIIIIVIVLYITYLGTSLSFHPELSAIDKRYGYGFAFGDLWRDVLHFDRQALIYLAAMIMMLLNGITLIYFQNKLLYSIRLVRVRARIMRLSIRSESVPE